MRRDRLYKGVKDPTLTIEVQSIPSQTTIHGRQYYALAFKNNKPHCRVPLHQIQWLLQTS